MNILLFDNHDSFTWNLFHDLERAGANVDVFRFNELDSNIKSMISKYDAVVLSPGPGMPSEAPMLMEVLSESIKLSKPVLGVCLGFQAIVEFFSGRLENMSEVLHGRVGKMVILETAEVFANIASGCEVGHYHSWCAEVGSIPTELSVIGESESGITLAISHKTLPIVGFQFHPESILTPDGRKMLENWVRGISS
ncbi:MAG: anthranilate synthase component II [Flavobacteriales bacterium]|jgi:anthranilate synthase component 2